MIKLYETNHLRISYEPRLRLLEVCWLSDAASPSEFREGYWQALLLAERHQTRAWLSDFRTVPTPAEPEMQWLTQRWYPRYVQLKLDKVAIIRPRDPGALQALTRIVQMANEAGHTNRPDAQYFDDPGIARAWIEQPFTKSQLPPAG
ncbi:hypothetical protein LJ737_26175 [Hymenobacter sp. 15J16-1T3B]|uniref:hypothetical protein n=1 Tax=Hymenobacter sp. 15J16-1T3B TaxID=2886941 RepID=UPI001D0FB381|nr:hypothetical protein [Hymenobacter sp. 15J16-1T3B]MCC3160751.1 hypothetical protein [Hymenobacter sp. 15J16-1T3B]